MVHEFQSTEVGSYREEIKEGTVVVDIFATWCGPCKMLAPVFEAVSEIMSDIRFIKADVEKIKVIATELGVKSVPTLIVYKDGVELKRVSGYMPKEQIIKWIGESALLGV